MVETINKLIRVSRQLLQELEEIQTRRNCKRMEMTEDKVRNNENTKTSCLEHQ